jgi:hypothetical protein
MDGLVGVQIAGNPRLSAHFGPAAQMIRMQVGIEHQLDPCMLVPCQGTITVEMPGRIKHGGSVTAHQHVTGCRAFGADGKDGPLRGQCPGEL